MKNEYTIVKCDQGGWNVVDIAEVKDPLNGRIMGVTQRTRSEAVEKLRDLQHAANLFDHVMFQEESND